MNLFLFTLAALATAGLGVRLINAQQTILDLNRRLATAEQLAGTDPLTGLANRVGLHRALGGAPSAADDGHIAALLLDLDRLKLINDHHGHPIGDAVLVEIARRITRPTTPVTCAARLGGDEFVIILPSTPHPDAPQRIEDYARTLWRDIGAPVTINGLTLSVTASIGIAVLPAACADQLLGAADKAMYRAKRTSAGICSYQPHLDGSTRTAPPTTPHAPLPQPIPPARRRAQFVAPPAAP